MIPVRHARTWARLLLHFTPRFDGEWKALLLVKVLFALQRQPDLRAEPEHAARILGQLAFIGNNLLALPTLSLEYKLSAASSLDVVFRANGPVERDYILDIFWREVVKGLNGIDPELRAGLAQIIGRCGELFPDSAIGVEEGLRALRQIPGSTFDSPPP